MADHLNPQTVDSPVEVPESDVPQQILTFVRYLVSALGGVMVTKGWLPDALANTLVGLVMMVVPLVWGMWRTSHLGSKLRTIEAKVPDSVAKLV